MNRRFLSIFSGIMALSVLIAGCGGYARQQAVPTQGPAVAGSSTLPNLEPLAPGPAHMVAGYVTGDVILLRDGAETPLAAGDALYETDQVVTGKDGMAVLKVDDGRQLQITASSRLFIAHLIKDEQGETTQLQLDAGTVISVINTALGEQDRYEIETPELIMAIRGTIASVSYDTGTEQSRVSLFEGSGVVSQKSSPDTLGVSAGERVALSQGGLTRDTFTLAQLNESERRFLLEREGFDDETEAVIAARLQPLLEKQEASAPDAPPSTQAVASSGGSLSLDDAKALFNAAHPDVEVSVAKQEGQAYYLEGVSGNLIYKMKVRISDGEILLDKTIQKGR